MSDVDDKRAAYEAARLAWGGALLNTGYPTATVNAKFRAMTAALDAYGDAVREDEREACAAIAYSCFAAETTEAWTACQRSIAAAIRARKETP